MAAFTAHVLLLLYFETYTDRFLTANMYTRTVRRRRQ